MNRDEETLARYMRKKSNSFSPCPYFPVEEWIPRGGNRFRRRDDSTTAKEAEVSLISFFLVYTLPPSIYLLCIVSTRDSVLSVDDYVVRPFSGM